MWNWFFDSWHWVHDLEWGKNVPTWLGAFGTTASIIVLSRARVIERSIQRGSQARLIRLFGESGGTTLANYYAVVKNFSQLPITDVVMWANYQLVRGDDQRQTRYWVQQLEAGGTWDEMLRNDRIDRADNPYRVVLVVRFLDAQGLGWHLDSTTGRVRAMKRADKKEYDEYIDKVTMRGSRNGFPNYIRQNSITGVPRVRRAAVRYQAKSRR